MEKSGKQLTEMVSDYFRKAKKKKVDLAKYTPEAFSARVESIVADHVIKRAVDKHADYVGPDEIAATSKKGWMIQFNKKIKKCFGHSVEEMRCPLMIAYVKILRFKAATKIEHGEANNKNRQDIRESIYRVIEKDAEDYWDTVGGQPLGGD